MNNKFNLLNKELKNNQYKWLVTGAAGFIGSSLIEELLSSNQLVVGIDNFSTGNYDNINEICKNLSLSKWNNFSFIEGDIRNLNTCLSVSKNTDFILHQAALGSVPRSINDPIASNETNISGFLNMIIAAKDNKVKNFVYASSSSTYGDEQSLPKKENIIGNKLSPYAVTKYVNELYADVFNKCYGLNSIGLRYFNVFGPRQDPNSSYSAVIPKWISDVLLKNPIYINGDGENSRDFTYIDNVVQMNLLAATTKKSETLNQIYNVACSSSISLNLLINEIKRNVEKILDTSLNLNIIYREPRKGDVRHSLADISKAKLLLNYFPEVEFEQGLKRTCHYYCNKLENKL
jgi:UDP-N-acetylglucosamine 4-epimerase